MNGDLHARLVAMIADSATVMDVLARVRAHRLPDWRLTAGAVYGTVWNALTGRASDHGIKDYDIAYFDPDVSWEAEDAIIRAVADSLPEALRPLVEVRNQARVHLWFEERFGSPYPPLACTDEALTRYLCISDCVAVRLEEDDRIDVAAPFGLEDLFAMLMRANPGRGATANRQAKVRTIQARWPEVRFVEDAP
jgi:uncharacterized protein